MNARAQANQATVTEAAETLDLSRHRLYLAVRRGDVPVASRECLGRGPAASIVSLGDAEEWAHGGYGSERRIIYSPDDDPHEIARARGISVLSAKRGIQRAKRRAE